MATRKKRTPKRAAGKRTPIADSSEANGITILVDGNGRPFTQGEKLGSALGQIARGLDSMRRKLDAGEATDDDRERARYTIRAAEPMHQPWDDGYAGAVVYALSRWVQ